MIFVMQVEQHGKIHTLISCHIQVVVEIHFQMIKLKDPDVIFQNIIVG